jgi:hypothetical protein
MTRFNTVPKPPTYPCIKWLYGSNDQKTWWYYDEDVSEQIEKLFDGWKSKEDVDDVSDDDSDTNIEYPEIQIGPYAYEINFHTMSQNRGYKQRRMLRMEFNSVDEKQEFDKNVRGIIGIKFS